MLGLGTLCGIGNIYHASTVPRPTYLTASRLRREALFGSDAAADERTSPQSTHLKSHLCKAFSMGGVAK